mmetsp:Transcript_112435/g.240095  ORF Transcript_112435/g.240095 Transcript_112435/m.240095 type:complete len:157 (-) Transcript_112435:44-514(-)
MDRRRSSRPFLAVALLLAAALATVWFSGGAFAAPSPPAPSPPPRSSGAVSLRALADRPDLAVVTEDLQPVYSAETGLPPMGFAPATALLGDATEEQLLLAGLYGEFFEQGRAQGPTRSVVRDEVTMKKTRRGRRGVLTKLKRKLAKYLEPPKPKKG